eukprot:7223513-Alexandrium_andersonii.AAC.1
MGATGAVAQGKVGAPAQGSAPRRPGTGRGCWQGGCQAGGIGTEAGRCGRWTWYHEGAPAA